MDYPYQWLSFVYKDSIISTIVDYVVQHIWAKVYKDSIISTIVDRIAEAYQTVSL